MANICVLKSGNVRVQFRKNGLSLISRTFTSMREAKAYSDRMETEIKRVFAVQQSMLPIDTISLYTSLHPDLKQAVLSLPMFSQQLGIINGSEMTLADLIDKYIMQYTKKDQYILHRLKWWSDQYGHVLVKDFNEDHVRLAIRTLLTYGMQNKRGSAPQTTNRFKANLSSVFEFGKEYYQLKNNPCRNVKSKPEGKGRQRYLSDAEQQRFLGAARCSIWDKFYLLILMAITTGARRGELISKLRWCDID